MCYSQQPNQFQVRPSFTKVVHRKITEQKEEQIQISQCPCPIQQDIHFMESEQREEQTIPIQPLREKKIVKSVLNIVVPPNFISKPTKRKQKLNNQSSTQKISINNNRFQVCGDFKYQRPLQQQQQQQQYQGMSQSFHTAYAPSQQQKQQLTLFQELLNQAPKPKEITHIKVIDCIGEYELCQGEIDSHKVEYYRHEGCKGGIYDGFLVQLI